MREDVWTEDGISLLRKMWAEGATAATIGARLGGFSRSAVLGKVFRLRLNGEGDTADRIERAASEPDSPRRRRGPQPRKTTAAPPAKDPGRFTLFDLNNESCRSANCAAGPMRTETLGTAGTRRTVPPSLR
jgi:hypothetical protein